MIHPSAQNLWKYPIDRFYKLLPLKTDRLRLRKYKAADAEKFYEITSNPLVTRYMVCKNTSSLAEAKRFIRRAHEAYANKRTLKLAIADHNNQFIGTVSACLIAEDTLEIGYWIDPVLWGQGYATEALSIYINALKRANPSINFCTYIAKENIASLRVAHKLGFVVVDSGLRAGVPIFILNRTIF